MLCLVLESNIAVIAANNTNRSARRHVFLIIGFIVGSAWHYVFLLCSTRHGAKRSSSDIAKRMFRATVCVNSMQGEVGLAL
jgi:hypothetical protein